MAPPLRYRSVVTIRDRRKPSSGLAFRAVLLDHIKQSSEFIGRRTGARKDGRVRTAP
jgi:hypothetical protein